jgi:hypothetical protein
MTLLAVLVHLHPPKFSIRVMTNNEEYRHWVGLLLIWQEPMPNAQWLQWVEQTSEVAISACLGPDQSLFLRR